MKKQIILTTFLLFSIGLFAQKISDLPPANHLDSNNLFPIVQTGVTKKLKASEILNYIVSQYPLDTLGDLPLTVTTSDYVSSSGSEAIAFTNLQIWNDTLDLGSAVTREDNRIYVFRTDFFGNAVVINATPSMEYKTRSTQEFKLDKNMTGCILQSNGLKWYILGVFYDPYYRPTLAAFSDSSSIGGYTANEVLTVSGAVNIGASGGTHEGTMQYNGSNFEGYDGSAWIPFDNWKRDAVNGEIYPNNTNDQLGLGTADPAEQLEITKNFRMVNTTATTGIIYRGASPWLHDFKGIGTTGQNVFLGGGGNLTLTGSNSGDEGSMNTIIGYNSNAAMTTGYGNSFFGHLAGAGITTGAYNTAIGQQSLYSVTTGGFNVAVGWYALKNNTASNMVAIGKQALTANTNGYENTAIGAEALLSNMAGYQNTAIGYQAMRNVTTSYASVAIGDYAMAESTDSAITNVAVGNGALVKSNRACNVAVGTTALQKLTLGSDNVGIGTGAGLFRDRGDGNIAIGVYSQGRYNMAPATINGNGNNSMGTYSLASLSTGSFNTVIGDSGAYSLTTGSQNIMIGNKAGFNQVSTSKKMFIDIEKFGSTALDSTSSLIFGNFVSNRLTVNGNFQLPNSSTSTGIIYKESVPFLSNYYATGTSGLNTWLGIGAGNLTLTGSDSGDEGSYNTAIGNSTLTATTTGNQNTAIGAYAGTAITSGTLNTSCGTISLYSNQTGIGNSAFGYQALKMTTVNYLTAFGYNALMNNTTGTSNAAFGYGALSTNVGAKYNTAVGYAAMLYANNNAAAVDAFNTALGFNALMGSVTAANNTGTYNTAIGAGSLSAVTSGYFLTALGTNAGSANTTGHDNLFIGYGSGTSLTSGSSNVLIGSNAGGLLPSTSSGNVIIGYNAFSATNAATNDRFIIANNATTQLIDGDFSTGNTSFQVSIQLIPRSAAPGTPLEGMIYYDSDDHKLKVYNGSGWQDCY